MMRLATPVLLLLVACHHDRGPLYDSDRAGADGAAPFSAAGSGPEVDPHEAALELFGSDCATCLERECMDQVAACAAWAACAEEVSCRHLCTEPACHEECVAAYANGQEPSASLAQCAADGCTGECAGIGRDYGCTGEYSWGHPTTATSTLKLQLGQFTSEGAADPLIEEGIRVRVCPDRAEPECSAPREFFSNATGEVDLVLANRGGDNRLYMPFDGFLAFDDPERATPRVHPTLLFFERSWVRFDKRIDTLVVTPSSPFGPDPATGFVAGVLLDCRSGRALGLHVEIDGVAASIYDGFGETTGPYGFFARSGVTPGVVEVSARERDRLITSMRVPVLAGTVTYLWLWPAVQAE